MDELEIAVYRRWETRNSVGGEMWWNHRRQLYTLEPSRLTPVHPGYPCIPAGRYRASVSMSPHLGYECLELQGVPGRTGIRIHVGNYPEDILGCTVVGLARELDKVIDSRKGFSLLMSAVRGADPVYITYNDHPAPQGEIEWTYGETENTATEQPASGAA